MATATFIENDFGTATAWVMVYNAWWFELIMFGLALCFMTNIYKYGLWQRQKWPILLFHLAFIITLVGAGITRYSSYTGIMRIREGSSSNIIISDLNYLQLTVTNGIKQKTIQKELSFSPLKNNDFTIDTNFEGIPITIAHKDFIADAIPSIVADSVEGVSLLEIVVSHGTGKQSIFLKKGEIESIEGHHEIAFDTLETSPTTIIIKEIDSTLYIKAPQKIDFFEMSTQKAGVLEKDSLQPLKVKTLYRMGDLSMVPAMYHPKGSIAFISDAEKPKDNDVNKDDALQLEVTVNGISHEVDLLYREGFLPSLHPLQTNDLTLSFSYGAKPITTPFSIYLEDFQLERYPGSSSPSSYASEVKVLDQGHQIPFRIFMNNVLDYGGYRFFQASYDTDELGTVLSVNHDRLGTLVTYLGYLLMGIGMFFTFFTKNSRFRFISKKLKNLKKKQLYLLVGLLLFYGGTINAQEPSSTIEPVNEIHAEYFGRILVQDLDGRIKPINTLASEFLRKLSRKTYLIVDDGSSTLRLNPNQVFLGIHMVPNYWQSVPIIRIDKEKGGDLLKDLETTSQQLISFDQLLTPEGNYLLAKEAEEANQKKPAERNEFDKEILKIDERFNILYNIFIGNYLKIFPKPNDSTNTWYSYTHHFSDFPAEDANFCRSILTNYYKDIIVKDWESANEKLSYIQTFQNVLGEQVVPSIGKIEAEIFYNQINLNFWLFQVLFTIGMLLLVLAIWKIFNTNKIIEALWNVSIIITLVAFLAFTANLILRWYVAEHAPWSNGYEMLVFVAWCLLLCGILIFRKSDFTLPLATLFSGALLFVSYLDWLNPEITNLMPVLKSYWLKIHVATIVSSYAPLALAGILGLMSLILMIIKTNKNKFAIETRIKELTYINEMSMTIGLFVLAIGTFLGGVWANESWGRYWAWDPKETWALISIIIYAVVLHLRFVPKLNTMFTLNTASVFAFWSIIMTSFGVNYYLTGLHSYATGDPVPIPKFIYVLLGIQIIISLAAYFRNRVTQ